MGISAVVIAHLCCFGKEMLISDIESPFLLMRCRLVQMIDMRSPAVEEAKVKGPNYGVAGMWSVRLQGAELSRPPPAPLIRHKSFVAQPAHRELVIRTTMTVVARSHRWRFPVSCKGNTIKLSPSWN